MPNRTCLLFVFLALQLRMEAATAALIAIFLTLEFRLLAIQFNWVSRPLWREPVSGPDRGQGNAAQPD